MENLETVTAQNKLAAFISPLVFAVAISMISPSRLVFTLIRRLHYRLREACIIQKKSSKINRNFFSPMHISVCRHNHLFC